MCAVYITFPQQYASPEAVSVKKFLLVLLCALFISCLFFSYIAESTESADVSPAAPGARSAALWFDTLNSAKHPVMLKYRTMMDLGMGEETTTVTINIKDETERCVDLSAKSHHIGVLTADGDTTVMLHQEALYVKVKAPALNIPRVGARSVVSDVVDPKTYLRAVGSEEIDGQAYEFEEMAFDGMEPQTFFYEKESGKWRYWRVGGKTFEIVDYSNEVARNAFLVPAWYSEVRDVEE